MEQIDEVDPFFIQLLEKPTLTYSYFHKIDFYTIKKFNFKKIYKASADIEWNYRGNMIKSDEHTFCNFVDYSFTVSHALSYNKYFYPAYSVEAAIA